MAFLTPFLVWLASGTLAATLTLSAIELGLTFAVKGVVGLFGKSSSKATLANDSANHSVTVRQPSAPRRVVVGRDLVGGIFTFMGTSGTTNEFLELVITMTGHEIDAFEEIWFDDKQITFDGSGNATSAPYVGFAKIEYKLGAAGEAAFPNLVASLPSLWTSAHKQEGCASIHLQLKYDSTVFSGGIPNVRAKIRGAKMYDPRSPLAAPAWSDNSALIARWYLAQSFGLACSDAEIDDALVIAAANICDETVATASSTESRYRCDGTFDMSERPGDVLKDLITSMSGRCVWSGGKWSVYAGAYRAPVLAYDEDDVRGGSISVSVRRSRRDICNGVKGTFIDPNNQWQPTDFPAYFRGTSRGFAQDDYILEDAGVAVYRGNWATSTVYAQLEGVNVSGSYFVCNVPHTSDATTQPGVGANWTLYWSAAERIWRDVEFRFTKSAAMAQRLAKIELESNRKQTVSTIPFKLSAYQSVPPDVIQFSFNRYGWVNKEFEITQLQLAFDADSSGSPMIGVTCSLAETGADVYPWSGAEDLTSTTAPAIGVLPTSDNSSSLGSLVATDVSAGHVHLSWTLPTDYDALDGTTTVTYKLHGATNYTFWSQVDGTTTTEDITGLTSGSSYDFRIQNSNVYQRRGSASQTTHTAP